MKRVQTTARGLILRSLPQITQATDTGGRLKPGETATAYGATFDGAWLYVAAPDGAGWAAAAYLREAPAPPPSWRVAGSLKRLLAQVNAAAPERRRTHDGTIGDSAHAARKSDHNPNVAGVVTALDLTHDPARGCDCAALAAALVESRDARIKYLIFRGRIVSSKKQPWAWRPYDGANAHASHLHVSVDPDPGLYDDARPWDVGQ